MGAVVFFLLFGLYLASAARAEPGDSAGLRRQMVVVGIAPRDVIVAFAASDSIRRYAKELLRQHQEATAKDLAHRLYEALLALRSAGEGRGLEADADNSPKARPPKTADQLLRIGQSSGDFDRRAGCYEFSILYLALARVMGLQAVGVQRRRSVGTGQIGHVMAGVRFAPGGPLTLFDLQNKVRGSRGATRELSDMEFAAHHYNHLAVAAFLHGNLPQARLAIDAALLLAREDAGFLNNRATVLAASGEPVVALADVVYAIGQAPRVPLYRYQHGRILLALARPGEAVLAFDAALQLRAAYGVARRDRGWALLLLGHETEGLENLKRAVEVDNDTPAGHLYLGLASLALGKTQQAEAAARQGLQRQEDDSALLALQHLLADMGHPGAVEDRLRLLMDSISSSQK